MRVEAPTRVGLAVLAVAGHGGAFLVAPPAVKNAGARRAVSPSFSSSVQPCSVRHSAVVSRRGLAVAQLPLQMGLKDGVSKFSKSILGVFGTGASASKSGGSSRTRSEGAALYRSMGVPEDAEYEEVIEAFEQLKEKYKGDRKAIVKLEKTKDDIMDLRLRQRMAGTLKVSNSARDVDNAMDAMEKRRKKFVAPAWTKGWLVLPKEGHAMRMLYYHGMMMGVAVVFPTMANAATMLGTLLCIGTMTSRGAPEARKDEMGQIMEYKMPGKFSMLSAFAIAIPMGFVGGICGVAVGHVVGQAVLLMESWQAVGTQAMYLLLGTFVSTYREGRSRGKGVYN